MTPTVRALSFQHVRSLNGALLLRKDGDTLLPLPEWHAGSSSNPLRVAFARGSAPDGNIAIAVELEGSLPPSFTLEAAVTQGAAVLGQVPRQQPQPLAGRPGWWLVHAAGAALVQAAVDLHCFEWTWKLRHEAGELLDEATVPVRLYTVLAAPVFPWSQLPDAFDLPWTELLERAVAWARGAEDEEGVAKKITMSLVSLGSTRFPPRSKEPYFYYVQGAKFCTSVAITSNGKYFPSSFLARRLLMRLSDDPDSQGGVNCTDCAAIISTMGALLGVPMVQLSIKRQFGDLPTNLIRKLGSTAEEATTFVHHDFAIRGETRDARKVWDACLAVDQDGDPALAPFDPAIPLGIPLGGVNQQGSYLALLIPKKLHREVLRESEQSRPLEIREIGPVPPELVSFLFPKGLTSSTWPRCDAERRCEGNLEQLYSELSHAGWEKRAASLLETVAPWAESATEFMLDSATNGRGAMYVGLFRCKNAQAARDVLWQLRQQLHTTRAQRELVINDKFVAIGDGESLMMLAAGDLVLECNSTYGNKAQFMQVLRLLLASLGISWFMEQ